MSKLVKARDITIEEINNNYIISSRKEIALLHLKGDWHCSIRGKTIHYYCGIMSVSICNKSGCPECFYKISNFLNVHKLIKKIKNEQANKLSKA